MFKEFSHTFRCKVFGFRIQRSISGEAHRGCALKWFLACFHEVLAIDSKDIRAWLFRNIQLPCCLVFAVKTSEWHPRSSDGLDHSDFVTGQLYPSWPSQSKRIGHNKNQACSPFKVGQMDQLCLPLEKSPSTPLVAEAAAAFIRGALGTFFSQRGSEQNASKSKWTSHAFTIAQNIGAVGPNAWERNALRKSRGVQCQSWSNAAWT